MKIKPDPVIKKIVSACFPNYNGRKFSVQAQNFPLDVRSYWDGGSRDYFAFYCLSTGSAVPMPEQGLNNKPMPGADRVTLPDGIICVERSYFQGKDCGITIHVNPANMPKFLPAGD